MQSCKFEKNVRATKILNKNALAMKILGARREFKSDKKHKLNNERKREGERGRTVKRNGKICEKKDKDRLRIIK